MNDDIRIEDEEELEAPSAEETDAEETHAGPVAELHLIRSGVVTGDTFPINGRAVIGRFDPEMGPIDVDLAPLAEAVYISRKHAVIEFAEGAWTITDLGSSNGTFVLVPGEDFQRIETPTEIGDGDQLSLGNARFTFHLAEEEDEETEDEDDV